MRIPETIRSYEQRKKHLLLNKVSKKYPKSCNALARLRFNLKKLMLNLLIREIFKKPKVNLIRSQKLTSLN